MESGDILDESMQIFWSVSFQHVVGYGVAENLQLDIPRCKPYVAELFNHSVYDGVELLFCE
jgi:hypothetical protein